MNKDEFIEIAIKLGFNERLSNNWLVSDEQMMRFAKMVAAKEREACALICDKEVKNWKYDADVVDVSIAIRERGQQ